MRFDPLEYCIKINGEEVVRDKIPQEQVEEIGAALVSPSLIIAMNIKNMIKYHAGEINALQGN
jgi:hypothetical protein